MGKNILQRTNERIAELNAKREADLAEIHAKINRAQESIAAAEADMHDAEFTGDIKAYEMAQEVRKAANNVVSFHLARMDILSKNKLVTPSEDASVMNELKDYQHSLLDQASAEIADLLAKAVSVWDAYIENDRAVNETMWRWHKDVYPQMKSSGMPVKYPSDLAIDKDRLRWVMTDILNSSFYEDNVTMH